MATLNIYLTFNGNCEESFNFYKAVLGGEFTYLNRYSEMPPQEGMTISDADKNKIMHVTLALSDKTVLMGSDTSTAWNPGFKEGNNFSISIPAESKTEGDRLFAELSNGGKAGMPMNETFWGSYFGMLTDKFGINWMINVDLNQK